MVKVLFDTNILIDYLNGVSSASEELALYDDKAISVISWIEVMVGTNSKTEKITQDWLKSAFTIISIEEKISYRSIGVRKMHKMKLPDAIIYATAMETGRLLISRNTKYFSPNDPMVREPYKI